MTLRSFVTFSARLSASVLSIAFLIAPAHALETPGGGWTPVGPEGGDARAFAADPLNSQHVYLGTVSGWVYESNDGGAHWARLSNVAGRSDLVLDSLIVDPSRPHTLYLGAWVLGSSDGGFFVSNDSGRTWAANRAMSGQSIRALTMSATNPHLMIAGTLQGVYRTMDSGATWQRMSPPENAEIHEVESIAIDPKDNNVVYAGTWHLPWKTEDGGQHWHNIKQGLIDDSDVFSIIVDPAVPTTVFLSACSGIYKSIDGAQSFNKIQGIPSTARRTRVLMQDPVNRSIVYAGTTEGLYRTTDSGKAWVRMTSPDVIVNDVFVDPKDNAHVVLATDRSGVLTSHDGATSFADTNRGFMQRQVSAIAADPTNPQHIYTSVLNDKSYGGVFESLNGGLSWQQRSIGLAGRDVYSLQVAKDGTVVAGTTHGVMLLQGVGMWQPAGKIMESSSKSVTSTTRNPKTKKLEKHTKTVAVAGDAQDMTGRVSYVWLDGDTWYAASEDGLFHSADMGHSWQGGPVIGEKSFTRVIASGSVIFAANRARMVVSQDKGTAYRPSLLPDGLTRVVSIAVSPDGLFWVAGPEGVWVSHDNSNTWTKVTTLPISDISNIVWDQSTGRMLVTSWHGGLAFGSSDGGQHWKYWSTGWEMRSIQSANGHLFGASLFNGVVMDPAPLSQSDLATPASPSAAADQNGSAQLVPPVIPLAPTVAAQAAPARLHLGSGR